ncbi:hypothetical protein HDV62DRAFT_115952 [Trichoderma sp. SZMC 28011]
MHNAVSSWPLYDLVTPFFFNFYTIQRILSAFREFFFVFLFVFKDHAHTPSIRGFFTMIPSGRTRQALKDMTPLHPRFPFFRFIPPFRFIILSCYSAFVRFHLFGFRFREGISTLLLMRII